MESVIRHPVGPEVGPDIVVSPFEKRVELQKSIGVIPRLNLQVLALRGLFAPQAGHPAFLARQGALEGKDLAHFAALKALGNAAIKAIGSILLDPGFDGP